MHGILRFCFYLTYCTQYEWKYLYESVYFKELHKLDQGYSRPLPSSKNPHFQNEDKCTTVLVKISFICMRLHTKGWALNLVLIQRPEGTLKWPIDWLHTERRQLITGQGNYFYVSFICRTKAVPSFLNYFKTLSISPDLEIEPATFRSGVKRSTDGVTGCSPETFVLLYD